MAVATMSDIQNKTLHPFFSKPTDAIENHPVDAHPSLTEDVNSLQGSPQSSQPEQHVGKPTTRTRKTRAKPDAEPQNNVDFTEDQTSTPRKRRKLTMTNEGLIELQGSESIPPLPSSPRSPPSSYPDNLHSIPTPEATMQPPTESEGIPQTDGPSTPPKKMLKLRPGGRLVSPVSKPAEPVAGTQNKKQAKRGRPKKERHLIAVLRYPPSSNVGHRMNRILDGTERFNLPNPSPPPPVLKPNLSKPELNKPTHPFFGGKPKDPPSGTISRTKATLDPVSHSPKRPSAVTPGKLRAQRREEVSKRPVSSSNVPQFGATRDRNVVKQPGMSEAPFPPKGHAHVRGDFQYHTPYHPNSSTTNVSRFSRKMKHTIQALDPSESVLARVERSLDYRQKDKPRTDGFYDPPPSMRVPSRHLIAGTKVQSWISKELGSNASMHIACSNLFDGIKGTLTPFDEGKSEIQAWAQKYSPKLASEVLQSGRQARYLRDWMKALTISAVETSGSHVSKSDKVDREQKPKKKRRKKTAELDDFIVNDDEVENRSDKLVELEEVGHGLRPSLVRDTDLNDPKNRAKITNSIIISGPSGSGKTAMVHAAARELGFEIFEINSGSRRSGKDVLDKIGDMLENHLVQNHSTDAGNTSADEDAGRLTDAFNKDLESGRQGTMKSFFSMKPTSAQPKKKKDTKPKSGLDLNQVQKALSTAKPSKGQKQSLILLEEVDIMFEEDKGFWTTVFTLLQTSKRPIIMTCNDEDHVPIQAIEYQALLRLVSPPLETAVDYLLLMSAREGHLLQRDAVATLFESKKHDLRASIAELQLWCQMGVGDPRGGLGWIYQRWPHGSGIDKDGQPIRVISEGTYHPGMGFFLHETETSMIEGCNKELLKESWEIWGIDPREKLFSSLTGSIVDSQASDAPLSRLDSLKQYSACSDTLSDMDSFCRVDLPGEDQILLDPTQPELPEKSRASYVNTMALLQTPPVFDYINMDTQLAISCSTLASTTYSVPIDSSPSQMMAQITEASRQAHNPQPITRADFSSAFDSIASLPIAASFVGQPMLTYSVLDGPLRTVVADVAPYVRSIAAYDLALEVQRAKLHNITGVPSSSGSGVGSKRARTTRAARSALEGGQRQLTRRERWFDSNLSLELVLQTAGENWPRPEGVFAETQMPSPGSDIQMQDT